jgi:hypothetical protein
MPALIANETATVQPIAATAIARTGARVTPRRAA